MNEIVFESLERSFKTLKMGIDASEFARLSEEESFSEG